ncbi:hypothetical protein MBLNU459_g0310t1 [Dothideomycetes sp. NU459]
MSPTVTMTSRLQRPPPLAPPTIPLPPLPMHKTRQSLPGTPSPAESRRGSSSSVRRIQVPAVSRSVTPSAIPTMKPAKPVKSQSTPNVPTLDALPQSSSAIPTPQRVLRKAVSIESFPQPPKGTSRISSLPPSPLSMSISSEDTAQSPGNDASRAPSSPRNSLRRKPKAKTSLYGLRHKTSAASLTTSSLLSNAAETRSISSAAGARASEGFLTLPSPTLSRSSSANGSFGTEVTTFEDIEEEQIAPKMQKSSNGYLNQQASSTVQDGKGNVTVSVRVRPDSGGGDGATRVDGEWMVDGRRSLVSYKGREAGEYLYDNVFSAHDNNARVYDSAAKRLVRRVMEGYHGTVFAYGMTGTGKTFSMQGTAQSPGVIPLAITDIFSYIREKPDREFLLRVSYLEIYNEKIYDLLSPSSVAGQQQEEIKLREDSRRGVYATPLKEEIVQSPNQLLRVIARGDQARKVASTQFNSRSSRSHAVVQIVVESRERSGGLIADVRKVDNIMPGGVLVSTLSLIDLAGSEKAADNKERRTEGAHINKSLLTLGTVIGRLSDDKEKDKENSKDGAVAERDTKHVPYRDSKLTRLLQPALSGNSIVSILCTIQLSSAGTSAAAASSHTGETLNTLKFASRAKNNIVSHAKRNESDPASGADPNSRALLDRYRLEIQELRHQLEAQSKTKVEPERGDEEEERWRERERESENRHEEQMLEMQLARTALKERISHLNRLILSSKSLGVNTGRFSTDSTKMHTVNRSSTSSAVDLANSRRQSAFASEDQSLLNGTVSAGSAVTGLLPFASPSQIELASASEDEEDDDLTESPSGNASSGRRIRALQADLSDKNRYIATLEKRLLQARRTSQSRPSLVASPKIVSASTEETPGKDAELLEKDREIKELKNKLEDQIRMVTALRSAARKRELLDAAGFGSEQFQHPAFRQSFSMAPDEAPAARRTTSRPTLRSHASQASSSSAGTVQNFSRLPLSPVALLSEEVESLPPHSASEGRRSIGEKANQRKARRNVDEMTRLLDEMITDKVDSGQLIRGDRGSLRLKRDTVIERKRVNDQEAAAVGAV